MKPRSYGWLAVLLAVVFSNHAWAQFGGNTGGTGGGTTIGGGTTGGTGTTGSALSSSQTSSITSQSIGTTLGVRKGFLPPGLSEKGFLSPSNANASSVGGGTSTTSRTFGTTGLGTTSRFGGLSGLGGLGMGALGGTTGRGGTSGTTSTTPVRIPLRITPNPTALATALNSQAVRFNDRLRLLPGLETSGVSMRVEGRTAVLRGTVASTAQADQMSRLAMLEPGISAVRNELNVNPALARPEELPSAQQQ